MNPGVVVTGVSLVTPWGTRVSETLEQMQAGAPVALGLELDLAQTLGVKGWKHYFRNALMACLAVRRLQEDGVVLDSGTGLVIAAETNIYLPEQLQAVLEKNCSYLLPTLFINAPGNIPASLVAIKFGIAGLNIGVSSGTTASLEALEIACRALQAGRASVVVAGGCEERIAVLEKSLRTDFRNPENRTGLLNYGQPGVIPMGEGCGLLVLESASAAGQRGRPALARILGFGQGLALHAEEDQLCSQAVETAVRMALDEAALDPEQVEAVFLSANGDYLQDRSEAEALTAVFRRPLPAAAIKGSLTETLHAGGALAAGIAILSLRRGFLPATPNLASVDWNHGLSLASTPVSCPARRVLVLASQRQRRAMAMLMEIAAG